MGYTPTGTVSIRNVENPLGNDVFWREASGLGPTHIQPPEVGDPLTVHRDYGDRVMAINFFGASYRGGPAYRRANDASGHTMLYRHEPRETVEGYQRRLKMAVLKNHCRPIVRKFNSYVFRQEVRRDGSDQAFGDWCKDVDGQGTSLQTFMRRIVRKACVCGRYYVGIDTTRPATAGEMTVAQARAAGVRVILTAVDPRRVIDWRHRNGALVEAMAVYDAETAILWTATTMQVFALGDDGKVISAGPVRPHGFAALPIIEVAPFEDGESQIADIAELQRDSFNLEALLREEIYNATFTQHWVMGGHSEELEDQAIGAQRILFIRNPEAKLDTTGGDSAQADSIRKTIDDNTTEIYRLAGLKAEDPLTVNAPKSGVALKVEFDDLDAVLSAIADEAERAENTIIDIYNGAMSAAVEHSDYPDSFGTPDVMVELQRAFDVLESPAMTPTAKNLESRRVNGILHPKADPEDRQAMDQESLAMYPRGIDPPEADGIDPDEQALAAAIDARRRETAD